MQSPGIFDYGHGISAVDSVYDRRMQTAIHLLVEEGRAAVIDTGTSHAVPHVLKALEAKRQGKPGRVGPERLPVFTFPEPRIVESAFGLPAERIAVRPFADVPRAETTPHPALSPEGRGKEERGGGGA